MRIFSSLDHVARWVCPYQDPFIVMWEIPSDQKVDECDRKFIVFNGIDEYKRSSYRTCHEVLIPNTLSMEDDVMGYPAFDIDGPLSMANRKGWEEEFENDVANILSKIHPSKETNIKDSVDFVWLISPSDKKVSRHLVVRGVVFVEWRYSSTILYREMKKWGDCIDGNILRKKGCLRLPLNSKVDGMPLVFRDDRPFEDGVILIHEWNRCDKMVPLFPNDIDPSFLTITDIIGKEGRLVDDVDDSICGKAFSDLDTTFNTGLKISGESGSKGFINLTRQRPGTCPISGKVHDRVGAYMYMSKGRVYYGCHRGCTLRYGGMTRKTIDITPLIPSMAKKIAMEKISTHTDQNVTW